MMYPEISRATWWHEGWSTLFVKAYAEAPRSPKTADTLQRCTRAAERLKALKADEPQAPRAFGLQV